MSTPYIGFSNNTLSSQPSLKAGDSVECPKCGGQHVVEDSKPVGLLLFYRCGESTYLAAINGRSIMGVRADVKGRV